MDDTLTFRGQGTFEMRLQKAPTAIAEGKNVAVILPVFAAGFPQATAEMKMFLTIEHAEALAAQSALMMARVRSR